MNQIIESKESQITAKLEISNQDDRGFCKYFALALEKKTKPYKVPDQNLEKPHNKNQPLHVHSMFGSFREVPNALQF